MELPGSAGHREIAALKAQLATVMAAVSKRWPGPADLTAEQPADMNPKKFAKQSET